MSRTVLAILGLVLLIGASLSIGATNIFSGDLDSGMVLAISRIPRTLAAILSGAGLALAGVVIQQTVQNRLVEPGLVGTPEAAMIGLLAITIVAPGASLMIKMCVAAVTALIGTFGFFALAQLVPRKDPMLLPLVGLIYAGILGAVALYVAWITDLVQYMGVWQAGEFSGVLKGRYELLWIIAGLAVLLYVLSDRITILGLGEDYARSLGLQYRQTVLLGLGIIAVAVAVIVVTVGSMPFVGLVVPNIVSRLWGDNLRRNLPKVALLGAVSLLGADVIGRVVRWPYEIPAGLVFAIIGAAIFLWLLNAPKERSNG